jgi:hypothetical protein
VLLRRIGIGALCEGVPALSSRSTQVYFVRLSRDHLHVVFLLSATLNRLNRDQPRWGIFHGAHVYGTQVDILPAADRPKPKPRLNVDHTTRDKERISTGNLECGGQKRRKEKIARHVLRIRITMRTWTGQTCMIST